MPQVPGITVLFWRTASSQQPESLKSDSYLANIKQIRRLAGDLEIEIIPRLFDLGYAGGLLRDDVSLAEAMPVKETLLKVTGGKAVIAQ